MPRLKPSARWLNSVMLLTLLLAGCASKSPPPSAPPPNVAPRVIPPLSPAARQSPPLVPYLKRATENSENWRKQLQGTSSPASDVKPSTTP